MFIDPLKTLKCSCGFTARMADETLLKTAFDNHRHNTNTWHGDLSEVLVVAFIAGAVVGVVALFVL